jgi:hypothetical protein
MIARKSGCARPFALVMSLATVAMGLAAAPSLAHHGKDFLLLETDDLPSPGHVYALAAADTIRTGDGERATEITPALVFGLGNRLALEPHFHFAREGENRFRYDATALGIRYRIGNLGRSDWRMALSFEAEKPRRHESDDDGHDDGGHHDEAVTPQHANHEIADTREENSAGSFRLILARTFPRALVAINLIANRELISGGERSYGIGAGVLTPLSNGDQIGIETVTQLPPRDGIEILPSYSHRIGRDASLKVGVGLFRARSVASGTFHLQFVHRF